MVDCQLGYPISYLFSSQARFVEIYSHLPFYPVSTYKVYYYSTPAYWEPGCARRLFAGVAVCFDDWLGAVGKDLTSGHRTLSYTIVLVTLHGCACLDFIRTPLVSIGYLLPPLLHGTDHLIYRLGARAYDVVMWMYKKHPQLSECSFLNTISASQWKSVRSPDDLACCESIQLWSLTVHPIILANCNSL